MNIWTGGSLGLGYQCTLNQLITLKENLDQEIVVELEHFVPLLSN